MIHCLILCSIILYYIIYIILYICYIVLSYIISYYIVLSYIVLYYIIYYFIILYNINLYIYIYICFSSCAVPTPMQRCIESRAPSRSLAFHSSIWRNRALHHSPFASAHGYLPALPERSWLQTTSLVWSLTLCKTSGQEERCPSMPRRTRKHPHESCHE